MPKLTMGLGVLLVLTGVIGYVVTGAEHVTALIPAFFGALILVSGVIAAMNDGLRKHMMHASTALALIAFLGTVGAVRFLLYMVSVGPEHVDRPAAVIAQSVTAILCGIYLFFAIRSFIDARRARTESAE